MRALFRPLPEPIQALASLALDLRWSWSHEGDALWRSIDAATWERVQNPWSLLQDLPRQRIDELAADPTFLQQLARVESARREAVSDAGSWFAATGSKLDRGAVAFFCMEFGLGEAVPLYAGGLGILAGDYLKTASDLGLPVVGVGILFQEGYFRQSIDAAGRQSETYPYNDPTTLPIQPALDPSGSWLRVPVELPGRTVWLRVWRASIGRVDLFLLDANEPINLPIDRGITAKLYGGGPEIRLLQELVLGVGGWRVLEATGRAPSVAHLNEGHAAFVILERTRQLRLEHGLSFQEALWAVRAGNIFTTHTPVAAGFDLFSAQQLAGVFAPQGSFLAELGISFEKLLALGRSNPADTAEPFNMAYLALRGCARTNAVSRLHGEVSRQLFAPIFPRWPLHQVPIGHVTNGVHVPTWDSRSADALWTRVLGKGSWRGPLERHETSISKLSDSELWQMRQTERADLVSYARARLSSQLQRRGSASSPDELGNVLDPFVLTLGFARRFAEYKRPCLLLRDPERLTRLLQDRGRPVQLVIAGKAHPADEEGKRLIACWLEFVQRRDVRASAVFLEDYDMALAARLVAGVDVWINTPRRPWEACGTSGMKVLANGGLNVSELDGWWAEAYEPEFGWALGGAGTPDDARDAEKLYALLEREIVPEFYARDEQGLPQRWLQRIRASLSRLAPAFSSTRMAFEYLQHWYVPASQAIRARTADTASVAKSLAAWQHELELHWDRIRVRARAVNRSERHLEFVAEVRLDGLAAEAVRVELYAEPKGETSAFCEPMRCTSSAAAGDPLSFSLKVATERLASDFTPRVVAQQPNARLPAECSLIAWADASFDDVH